MTVRSQQKLTARFERIRSIINKLSRWECNEWRNLIMDTNQYVVRSCSYRYHYHHNHNHNQSLLLREMRLSCALVRSAFCSDASEALKSDADACPDSFDENAVDLSEGSKVVDRPVGDLLGPAAAAMDPPVAVRTRPDEPGRRVSGELSSASSSPTLPERFAR